MNARSALLSLPVALALALTGCSQIQEFRGQIDDIRWCSDVVRLAAAVDSANAEAARNLVDALDRSGPEDLADDVGVVRSVVEDIEAGIAEATALTEDEVTSAVGRLVDQVEERCEGELQDFGSE
ncbi:hypothetical protein QQX10_01585 [Demequina sp. SYSU T00039]|uniref:Lipoprotein n=1 Tax=Demequina lignilytica TaxID=3051663 RepID=A0AAW7M7U7_9MICO|nr:hypothetical protein [Demequina sp. SYSU T00039]MDN4486851.1 hypothetical protein [Demequina sp. SYSU T00039]